MKSKFLAGLVATLITLVFLIGISIFLALVLEIEPRKNSFTYMAAFLTIAIWLGSYRLLKPKEKENDTLLDGSLYSVNSKPEVSPEEFLAIYKRMPNKPILGGVIISGFFLPLGIYLLVTSNYMVDHFEVIGGVVMTLLGLLGIVVIVKMVIAKITILNGTDPMIKAIHDGNRDYVKWFYGVLVGFEGNPISKSNNYQIIIYPFGKRKGIFMPVRNKEHFEKALSFLEVQFPDAEKEDTPAIRERMAIEYGFKSRS